MSTTKHKKRLTLLLGLAFVLLPVLLIITMKKSCFSGCLDANLKKALEQNSSITSFTHRAFGDLTLRIHTLEIKYTSGLIHLSGKGRKPSLLKDYYLQGIDSNRIACTSAKGSKSITVTGVPLSIITPETLIHEDTEMVELSKIVNAEIDLYGIAKREFDRHTIEYNDDKIRKIICKLAPSDRLLD